MLKQDLGELLTWKLRFVFGEGEAAGACPSGELGSSRLGSATTAKIVARNQGHYYLVPM